VTEFEYKRIAFLIKQAEKGTYVSVGKGDASILSKLVEEYKNKLEWQKTLEKVSEELNKEI